jgi:hypothetical protein
MSKIGKPETSLFEASNFDCDLEIEELQKPPQQLEDIK